MGAAGTSGRDGIKVHEAFLGCAHTIYDLMGFIYVWGIYI